MKERVKEAVAIFNEGYSCSQAITAVYGDMFGLGRDITLKIASGLGGNCGGTGGVCGAVTGAILVLGLKYGSANPKDKNAEHDAVNKAKIFCEEFKARTGSLICREVYASNLADAEKISPFRQSADSGHCPEFVQIAVEILDSML